MIETPLIFGIKSFTGMLLTAANMKSPIAIDLVVNNRNQLYIILSRDAIIKQCL